MKLEEIGKNNYACVYCITFKNGKQYVGQTKCMTKRAGLYIRNLNDGNINSHCLSAINEFGLENTDWTVLCKVSGMSEDDKVLCLNILEMKYIKKLNTLYPNGYNRTNGGESLRISNGDIDLLSCGNFFNNEKRISMYNLDGIFIREYESISKCAYELGISRKCVSDNVNNRSSSFLGKYILREVVGGSYPEKIEPFKRTFVTKTITNVIHKDRVVYKDKIVYVDKFVDRNIQVNGKKVLKYNLDGEFVCEYDSIAKASNSVGRCYVKMDRVTCGYYFKLKTEDKIEKNIGTQHEELKREINMAANGVKNNNHNLRNDFELEQYSKDGVLISTYWGLRNASEKTGVPYSGIWSCIFGKSKSSGGFLWRRK